MDFSYSKTEQLFLQMIRSFAENEVKPLAAEIDEQERFPLETVQKMGKLGIMGIPVPKQYGGAGGTVQMYIMAVEELSRVCATTGVVLSAHTSLCMAPIMEHGTEEQKMKYLPKLASGEWIGAFGLTEPNAGTDAAMQQTTAVDAGDKWTQTKNNFNSQIVSPLKSGLSNVINYFSTNAGRIGDNMKTGMSSRAQSVGNAARDIYGKVKSGIQPAIDNARNWGGDISKKFGSGISSFKSNVSSAASGLRSAAHDKLSSLSRSAHSWGQDLASGFANGISSGWRWVRNAASNLADLVRSYIHFSTPDVGPLADFDTYAPDMIKTFASGIESSNYIVRTCFCSVTCRRIRDSLLDNFQSYRRTSLTIS